MFHFHYQTLLSTYVAIRLIWVYLVSTFQFVWLCQAKCVYGCCRVTLSCYEWGRTPAWDCYKAITLQSGCVHLSFFAPGSWIVLCQGDLFCALCCVVHHCYLQDPSSRVFSQAVTDKNVSRCQMTRAKSTPSENFWLKVRRASAFLLICVFIENVKYLEVIRQCCVLRIIVIFSIHVFLTIL